MSKQAPKNEEPTILVGEGIRSFQAGTKVVFGEGAVDRVDEFLDPGARRILVVTGGRSAREHGHLERLLNALGEREAVHVYAGISPNPRVSEVEEAARLALSEGLNWVVGLGGGSAMDAAKGVAAAAANGGAVRDLLLGGAPAPAATLPIVCLPTTAGTGSETSKGAILSDAESGFKNGLRGEALLPRLAVVDPELTWSVPAKVTAETGFDILTHAIETWVSRKASAFTAVYSRHAIAAVASWLPRLMEDLGDRQARRELAFASVLMGYNLANSSTCLPHRLQYPVGALTDSSHPAGLAALYPAWCRQTWPAAPEVFDYVDRVLAAEEEEGDVGSDRVAGFLQRLGIGYNLRELGVAREDIRGLRDAVSGDLSNDPGDTSPEALERLYLEAWDGARGSC